MFYITALLVITIPIVNGFPDGAPEAACNDLLPQHGGSPSTDPLPFVVNTSEFVNQTYIPNQLYASKYTAN